MIEMYHKTCFGVSKLITNNYSTSFSLGIKLFKPELREPIYNIYGFVRIADEIVDTFHDFDKPELMKNFREETFKAIQTGISTNPILHSFQKTVREYKIELSLVDDFLKSMEMDLTENFYSNDDYKKYIYGSAEVVGLMCLQIFTKGNNKDYKNLKPYAQSLGSAFQKVNFLRDLQSDIEDRNRIYLPNVNKLIDVSDFNKKLFELEIDKEFSEALIGIKRLPNAARLGVYVAYIYYLSLFKKLRKTSIDGILNKRIRISNFTKLMLLIKSFFQIRFIKNEFSLE
jgi:15-cis-phytoene synthase